MIDKPQIGIVIPAFNKEKDVFDSIMRLFSVLPEDSYIFKVVVVDDGSTDTTRSEITRAAAKVPIVIVTLDKNSGKGSAIRSGFEELSDSLQVFSYIDADLDLNPVGLMRLIEAITEGSTDIAIGSKRHNESKVTYPLKRRLLSRVFSLLTRIFLGVKVSDTQTGMKAYSREVISTCLSGVKSTGFAFDLELLAIATRKGFKVLEGPIELDYQFGSTVGINNGYRALRDLLRVSMNVRAMGHLTKRDS